MINGKIIKVCGMREAQNIRDVESLQRVDMMGFIFYPKSPRYIYELPAYLPVHARRVGVFVNEDKDVITMYADRFGLEYIQLHGKESPEYCQSLRTSGLKIIKAFSVARPKDLNHVSEYGKKLCNLFPCLIRNVSSMVAQETNSTGTFCILQRTSSILIEWRHQLTQCQCIESIRPSPSGRLRPEQSFRTEARGKRSGTNPDISK